MKGTKVWNRNATPEPTEVMHKIIVFPVHTLLSLLYHAAPTKTFVPS